mgnify:FL=1
MEAYLDNSATTCVYQETADLVCDLMVNHYGNPSAMHQKGVEAEQYIRTAQETLAKILKVKEKEIFFTSGGTESDNWALVGTAMANKRTGNHIITSAIEHPAVSAPLAFLEEQGFRITRLPVNKEGLVDVNELEEAITPETILVSIMYVNNEIGSVEPIGEIGRRIKAKNPKTYFHVDAIQAFGKYRIYPKRMGIDMLSVSGHKIHGPKGSGFLYIDEKVKIRPLILGGGQQNGMRSGTDNVPGIAGLAKSAEIVYRHFDEQTAQMRACKHRLIEGLRELDDVVIHGMPEEEGAPQIVNASFLNVRSEVLLHTLEDRQIYVSAGSACSSHKRAGSPTLTAIGASKAEMESAVRFSFSEFTTLEQIDYTLDTLREVLPSCADLPGNNRKRKIMITIQPEIEILSTESYEDMLRRIEKIGRVCYKSEERIGEGTAEKFIAGIIKRGHESVIEHGSITVKVTCDRGVTHEIVRHRIASYSQESTRYCNYSKDKFGNQITCIDLATGFSYDLDDENDRKKYEVWQKAMEAAEQYYFQMLELGAKPEEARSILPNSLKTEIVMTMNLREWRHFIRLRSANAAHPQMRQVSDLILKKFSEEYPLFFRDLAEKKGE